jgi:single-stranded-DNA-specific exonuclease
VGDDLKKWIPFKKIYLSKNTLKKELNISETMARLLINRDIVNVEDAKKFLSPDIKDLHNPYEMSGMSKTVERIEDAIKNKQKICIYGDYDVDGITSVAMLYSYIKELGGNVTYYIPNRADEGYGLNIEAIDKILSQNVELIITVDCGIRSIEEVEAVNIAGADIIITDHHQCGESLPDAYAIINPNQAGCNYPFKYLAGAGVVFKLIAALSNRLCLHPPLTIL